jgi:choline dehydrogenase-like flavoprotein
VLVVQGDHSESFHRAFVVDSSFFPSSAALNPGLTIAANALRVADRAFGAGSFSG